MPASNEALFRSHDQSALSGVDWEVAYRYDAFGNVLSRTETDHTAPSGSPESEAFDAYFHDIGQRSGGLGGLDDLLLTVDASGRTTRRFLHGPGVDEVLAEETVTDGTNLSNGTSSSTVTLWTLTDHLGSVVGWVGYELTGTAGAASGGSTTVEGWTRYSAFGQALTGPGSGSAGTGLASAVGTLHGYTGRWTDSRTGLQNNRARWYDADTGKWASEDPIGFAAGDANLSRYVGNGPVEATDPSGLQSPGGEQTFPTPNSLPGKQSRLDALDGIPILNPPDTLPDGVDPITDVNTQGTNEGISTSLSDGQGVGPSGTGVCVGVIIVPKDGKGPVTSLHLSPGASATSALQQLGVIGRPNRRRPPKGRPSKPVNAYLCGGEGDVGSDNLGSVVDDLRGLGIPVSGYVPNEQLIYIGGSGLFSPDLISNDEGYYSSE